jgi:hypothetical protein
MIRHRSARCCASVRVRTNCSSTARCRFVTLICNALPAIDPPKEDRGTMIPLEMELNRFAI